MRKESDNYQKAKELRKKGCSQKRVIEAMRASDPTIAKRKITEELARFDEDIRESELRLP